jgi:CheY-like chemotaxis protein
MGRVLLLEDHEAFRHQFERVFEGRLDHCFNVGEMAARGRELENAGHSWDFAFIDFELSDRYTGFGALDYLRTYSPATKAIVFTALGERGRTLFALAARRWFNVWAVLDKRAARDASLHNIAAGVNPSPQWDKLLAKSAVVDELFAKEAWLQIWHLWAAYGGSQTAICKAGKLGPHPVREFGKGALKAVSLVKSEIPTIDAGAAWETNAAAPHVRANEATAVPLVEFYRAHSNFFNAIELPDILERVQPWNHGAH